MCAAADAPHDPPDVLIQVGRRPAHDRAAHAAVFTNVRNPRAAVSRRDRFETTRVGRGATIGANATIICGVNIGDHAFVAAGAVVTRDVKPSAVASGVPSREKIREHLSGNYCRCTGYQAIVDAVETVAMTRSAKR